MIAEQGDDRVEQRRVGDPLEVGERAPGDAIDREEPLGLLRPAEVLDGAERADGRIEEGQQVADQDIVEVEDAIAVGVLGPQGAEQRFEGTDVLAADDGLGPDRTVAVDGPFHALPRCAKNPDRASAINHDFFVVYR
jgi:hypothetical protein